MGDKTGIQWTDATWNPTVGCSLVSPGCTNCYAMKQAYRIEHGFRMGQKYDGTTTLANGHPVWTGMVKLDEATLNQPARWQRGRRIFVNSMSDLFHEALSDAQIVRVLDVMCRAPWHTYQVLTKRPERMRDLLNRALVSCHICQGTECNYCGGNGRRGWRSAPPPHIWLGVSVEDQERADERIPLLLDTPAAVRFLSCEPLLGPITRLLWGRNDDYGAEIKARIDWAIVGGESGPRARPFDISWARDIVAQCKSARVACFVKQLGSAACSAADRITHRGNRAPMPNGFSRFLNDRKGGDIAEFPEDLQVREFPNARP